MTIDSLLFDKLFALAAESPRKRMNYDLRNSEKEESQRMLNAILPGSTETIHRHRESSESVVILKGCLEEVFFDEKGVECGRFTLNPLEGNFGIQIPQGTWHTVVVHEPSVIVEMKAGAYSPLSSCDVWIYE